MLNLFKYHFYSRKNLNKLSIKHQRIQSQQTSRHSDQKYAYSDQKYAYSDPKYAYSDQKYAYSDQKYAYVTSPIVTIIAVNCWLLKRNGGKKQQAGGRRGTANKHIKKEGGRTTITQYVIWANLLHGATRSKK